MNEMFRHARYVVGENPVTGFSFGLLAVLVTLAVFGPQLAPHDPFASNASYALGPPSREHWCATDLLGRDLFSRLLVAARLDRGNAA
jgi:peptide/nickel transport system permease protein